MKFFSQETDDAQSQLSKEVFAVIVVVVVFYVFVGDLSWLNPISL